MGRKRVSGLLLREGVWHIDKRIRGRRICQSTGTARLEEAERCLARVMEERRQAEIYGVRPSRSFDMAAAKFVRENQHKRSLASDIVQLKLVMPMLGHLPIDKIHLGVLQPWVEERQRQGKAAATINHGLKIVRRILNLAAKEWVDTNGLTWLLVAPTIRLLADTSKRAPYPLSWAEQELLFRGVARLPCADGAVCGQHRLPRRRGVRTALGLGDRGSATGNQGLHNSR